MRARPAGTAIRFFAGLLAIAAAGGVASAHDFWIEPESFTPGPRALVPIHLRVGEHFAGDEVALNPERIVWFGAFGPHGEIFFEGLPGEKPAAHLRISDPGVYVVGYRGNHARLQLAPEKFEAYLRAEGLERIVEERRRLGESARPGQEVYSRHVKAFVRVGGKRDDRRFATPLGHRLELIPGGDPADLPPGAALTLKLVYQKAPVEGALVVALRKEAPGEPLSARTNAAGEVALPLSAPGTWLVKSVHMLRAPEGLDADWESLWTSLTFQR